MQFQLQISNVALKDQTSNDTKENKENSNKVPEEESPDVISAAEKSFLQKIIRKGLVENKNDIEVQRKDPNSPLYSVKSFEELHLKPELLKGLYTMGFNTPSKIQV